MKKVLFRIQPEGKKYVEKIPVLLEVQNDSFIIKSPYHKGLVEELRAMKGAKWEKEKGHWRIPINERNIYSIKFLQGFRHPRYQSRVQCNAPIPAADILFEHQIEGVNFILARKQCMLAFVMGLGKTLTTLQALELIQKQKNDFRWWLVAPNGAQKEWNRQFIKWKTQTWPEHITTFESLYKIMDLEEEPPDAVVFDESIKIKNPNAQRSQIAYELCRLMRHRNPECYIILLSGAPTQQPSDWWHQIECIFPGWLREGDIFKFRRRYGNLALVDEGYGQFWKLISWKVDEVKKLGKRLTPLVLFKDKKDCLDLPDKIYDEIKCDSSADLKQIAPILADQSGTAIGALECLRELSDGFRYINDVTSDYNPDSVNHIGSKRYLWVGSAKLEVVKDLLDFYHTENGGVGKLVIYAVFQASIDMLYKFCWNNKWNCGTIDGRGFKPENILNQFDDTENYCIIANPACIHGLSFVKTDCLVYYSNSFVIDHRIQSEDRRDRPGMDTKKGTRIVDIINLDTDKMILDKIKQGIGLQQITLEEIKRCLMKSQN